MNIQTACAMVLVGLIGGQSAAVAKSFVWKVTRGDDHLYLAGTIHLLSPADYPLPAVFEQAYEDAEDIVLEANLDDLQTPQFQQEMMQAMMYGPDQSLHDDLSTNTLAAVLAFFGSRGVPENQVMAMRPALVAISITMMELQRLGLAGTGVDHFYMQQAKDDAKDVAGLETADEQLAFLVGMGAGREDELIMNTLEDVEEMSDLMDAMKSAWREGDLERLKVVALDPMIEDYPELYKALVEARNTSWVPRLEQMLESPEVELVLVGALHFVGEQGILSQLAARGCTVEQVDGIGPSASVAPVVDSNEVDVVPAVTIAP